MEKILEQIKQIASKYENIEKVVLFGSRAREDSKERSDIDLAVFNCDINDANTSLGFKYDVNENIQTLLKFDITFINNTESDTFLSQIKKDGVIIYEKPKLQNEKF